LPILVVTNVFNGLYFFFVRPLLYLKKSTIFVSIATVSTALLNIFLNYFFIINYGIIGAALATFISIITKLILVYIFAQRKYFIAYEFRRLIILSLLIIVSILFFYFIDIFEISFIKVITIKFLFLGSSFLFLIKIKFLSKSEIESMLNFISNIKKKI
ncbi:MAG: hypothetical protein DRJ10_07210, partial [Bacteroidetes bacterium]